jgi:hypothetical protein
MPQRAYQLTGPPSSWPQRDPGPAQGESHRVSSYTKVLSHLGKRLTGQIQPGRFLGLPRPQPGRSTGQAMAPGVFLDGALIDLKPGRQLVDGYTVGIAVDQLLDLGRV